MQTGVVRFRPRGGVVAMSFARLALAMALLAAGGSKQALAEDASSQVIDLSLEELMSQEVVVGASKYEQRTSEAPASVTIISAEEIARYGWRHLDDVLQSMRGFNVSNDRNYSYVGIRGFSPIGDYNSRMLLMIDGHRLNDNVYESSYYGSEGLLDLELVERVEIIRGPSSSIYGTSAFFGVINLVTRRAGTTPGAAAKAGVFSWNGYRGMAAFETPASSPVGVLLSLSRYDSRGQDLYFSEFDDPTTNNGMALGLDGDQNTRFFARASRGKFTLSAAYSKRNKQIPTASFGTIFNDPRNQTTDLRSFIDLRYEQRLAGGGFTQSRIYLDRYWYTGSYDYDYPPVTLYQDANDGRWWGAETQFSLPVAGRHRLLAGGEYRNNYRQWGMGWDVEPYNLYFDSRERSQQWAAFLQDDYRVSNRLRISAGVRHDQYESFGGTTNPRLAAIIEADSRTNLKLMYGHAFRAPNTYELTYRSFTQEANPNLEPETIRTYEAVAERKLGRNVRLTGSLFHIDLRGLVELATVAGDSVVQFRNGGAVEDSGAELELEGRSANGWMWRGSYTLLSPEDRGTEDHQVNSPRHMLKAAVSAPLFRNRFLLGTEVQYVGARATFAGGRTPGYTIAHLTLLERGLVKGFDIAAGVYNLFDQEYAVSGSTDHLQEVIPQDGRSARLTLSWSVRD